MWFSIFSNAFRCYCDGFIVFMFFLFSWPATAGGAKRGLWDSLPLASPRHTKTRSTWKTWKNNTHTLKNIVNSKNRYFLRRFSIFPYVFHYYWKGFHFFSFFYCFPRPPWWEGRSGGLWDSLTLGSPRHEKTKIIWKTKKTCYKHNENCRKNQKHIMNTMVFSFFPTRFIIIVMVFHFFLLFSFASAVGGAE